MHLHIYGKLTLQCGHVSTNRVEMCESDDEATIVQCPECGKWCELRECEVEE